MSNAIDIAQEFLRTASITETNESKSRAQILTAATRTLFSIDDRGSVVDLYLKIIDEFRHSTLTNEEKQDAFVRYLFHNFPNEIVFKWFDLPFEP